jgi:hypothetical protein
MDQLPFENLIVDDRVNGIFRVNRRAFTDPAILDIEKREIFDKSWLYAGHASEIAKPGDFVTRRVGGRPLILVRTASGSRARCSTAVRIAATSFAAMAPARRRTSLAFTTPGISISTALLPASPMSSPTPQHSTAAQWG